MLRLRATRYHRPFDLFRGTRSLINGIKNSVDGRYFGHVPVWPPFQLSMDYALMYVCVCWTAIIQFAL